MSRFFKGFGALIVLGGILVGVPAILLALAGNPFPTWEQLRAVFSLTPDYGNVILTTKLLPLACWAAWAVFAGPFLVEIAASVRGQATRKRWAPVRGQQKLAAALIGAVALMFAGSAANAAPAQATTTTEVVASTAGTSTGTWTVEEAAAQAVAAGSVSQPAAPAEQQQAVYVVAENDTLWDISEHYYNDGTRYPEIFDANRGVVQSDGRVLSDADLIHPGWELVVPGLYTQAPPPVSETPPASAPAPEPEQEAAPAPAQPPVVDNVIPDPGAGSGAEGGGVTGSRGGEAPAGADRPESASVDEIDPTVPLMTAGGVTALLAFGVLAALGRRRLQQRRRRAVGERIALPEGDAADYELEMAMVENPIGVEDVDNALRSLQVWAEDSGEQLPELLAVRVANDEVALYLATPAQLPAPFESQAEDNTAWIVRPGMAAAPTRPTVSPYPGLATIGVDEQDGLLLLDIEQIGSLNIVGDDETVHGVLNALACEFATNPWSDLIQVTLVGVHSGFAKQLDHRRIRQVDDVPALIRNLRGEFEDRRRALDSYGVGGVLEARTRATDLEAWPPHIIILGEVPGDELRDQLADLVTRMPRLGIATISNDAELVPGATVKITSQEHAEYFSGGALTPLPFRPQILAGEELALVQSLFETTSLDAHPADLEQEHARGANALTDTEQSGASHVDDASVQTPDSPTELEVSTAPEDGQKLVEKEPVAPDAVSTGAVRAGAAGAEVTATAVAGDNDAGADLDPAEPSPVLIDRSAAAVADMADAPDWPAPFLRVMGPPDAFGIADPDAMPGRGVEFLMLLLLQTGSVPGGFIQSKMWPDSVAKRNQNTSSLATQVRQALGSDPDGNPLLPEGNKHDGFTSHPLVRLDWHVFCDLIGPDLSKTPNVNLVRALRLVRGEPFDGTRLIRGRWQWTTLYVEMMRAAILDAADELAHRALRTDQHSQARFAARTAQATDPLNEAGWRLEIETAMKAGDTDGFNRVVDDMYSCVGGPDIEIDDATQELINQAHNTMPGLLTR